MNTTNQILFVGNGPYLNRGCEAIVRGTARILKSAFGDSLQCVNANQEILPVEELPDDGVIHRPVYATRSRVCGRIRETARHLIPNRIYRRLRNRSLVELVQQSQAVLSVGGDNFTLDYGVPVFHVEQNYFVRDMEKPLVIWGASIGPFDALPEYAAIFYRHLRDDVTAIFVREPESQDYLARHNIAANVHFAYDPAFAMLPEQVADASLGFVMPANAIGLNVSSLITAQARAPASEAAAWVSSLVLELRQTTGRPIVLLPHVTLPWSDDHLLLRLALDLCPDRSGLFLVPSTLNAAQLKHVISRLGCLVAGRTHATIAAFSTGIPTVSLAYSTKAIGINKLVFGHTEYAVAGDHMTIENILETTVRCLRDDQAVRQWLNSRQSEFTASAFGAGEILRKVVG